MTEMELLVRRLNAGSYLPPINEVTAMAKHVKLAKGKEFVFAKSGGLSKYPWDQWLNGDLLLLEQSVLDVDGNVTEKRDFDVAVDAMVAKLRTATRRRYKMVQVSKKDSDGQKIEGGLIIKAHDMTAEQRQAEDVRRAELKAANQADDGDDGTGK